MEPGGPHHATLEEWVKMFGGTAILGFLCTLLIGGKCVHHIFQRRGLIFGTLIIPPVIISGLLGLFCFLTIEKLNAPMSSDLRSGLDAIKGNLINFVFASLILGLTCGRSNSQHTSFRGIATSILHEGMPMIIYSQILQWGQSTLCFMILCILNYFNYQIPNLFPAMIPLGIEAGPDVTLSSKFSYFWDETIVTEAESLGLLIVCIVGILSFTFRPYFISKGWLGNEYLRDNKISIHLSAGTGQAEAFERSTTLNPQALLTSPRMKRSYSSDSLYKKETPRSESTATTINNNATNNRFRNNDNNSSFYNNHNSSLKNIEEEIEYETVPLMHDHGDIPSSPGKLQRKDSDDISSTHEKDLLGTSPSSTTTIGHASLGAHLSLISLTVFLAFGLSFIFHFLEINMNIHYHIISGIRMFKLSMCSALIVMIFILQKSTIRFNRDWFMRLCGLMLDLLVISALSKSHPEPNHLNTTHYILCSLFVFICLAWNIFCLFYVAKQLFPNYWFERALTLTGDSMGHCYTGLLFARTLDPSMESPVPAAYAYKLMLFFIPSSSAKNSIVVMMASRHGIASALLVCLCIVVTWILIFDNHFKDRFVGTSGTVGIGIQSTQSTSNLISMKNRSNDPLDLLHNNSSIHSLNNENTIESTLSLESDDDSDRISPRVNTTISSKYALTQNTIISGDMDIEMAVSGGNTPIRRSSTNNNTGNTLNPLPQSLNIKISLPKVLCSEPSSIVSSDLMSVIASFLSDSKASKHWKLAYSMRQHGASLTTVLGLTSKYNTFRHSATHKQINSPQPCIIIIEDSWGYIFGGYISPGLENKKSYYGNGESFVFSVVPTPQCYKWCGMSSNELFVLSNDKCFAMGGGGSGFAIQLDDELDTGVSNRSATFQNNTLSSSEFFKCLNVEVWVLETSGNSYAV